MQGEQNEVVQNTATENGAASGDNRMKWILVDSKKQRRTSAAAQRPSAPTKIRRERVMVTGTQSHGQLNGVEDRTIKLFTRRWQLNVTKEAVSEYVKSNFTFNGNQGVVVTDYRTNAKSYKCFLIIGTCSDPKTFYDPNKWPEKVQISRYFEPKKSVSLTESRNANETTTQSQQNVS